MFQATSALALASRLTPACISAQAIKAAFAKRDDRWIHPGIWLPQPFRDGQIQRRQMRATQRAREVGR